MLNPCQNHQKYNVFCKDCIAYTYGIESETYFEEWVGRFGEELGCGPNPAIILTAIQEMISVEGRMKKMIAALRRKK